MPMIINPYTSFAGGAADPLTFIASSVSDTDTLVIPATAQAGDLAVIMQEAINGSVSPTLVTPSGFTTDHNAAFSSISFGTRIRAVIQHKILVSGDVGASRSVMEDVQERSICLIFRPFSAISAVTYTSKAQASSETAISSQSMNVDIEVPPLVVVGFCCSTADLGAVGGTFATSGETIVAVDENMIGNYMIQNISASDLTYEFTDGGLFSGMVAGTLEVTM